MWDWLRGVPPLAFFLGWGSPGPLPARPAACQREELWGLGPKGSVLLAGVEVQQGLPGSQETALLAQEWEDAPQEGSAVLASLECPLLTVAVVWQRDQGSASQPPDQGRGAGATRRRKDQIYFCFGSNILGAVQQCQLKPDNYCSCKGQKNAKSELSILLRCLTANFHE